MTKAVDKKMVAAWGTKLVTATLYNAVRDAVLYAPQANFLWSILVVDDLTAISREDVVRTRLQKLPADIEEAMTLLLSRLARRLDEYAIEDLNDLVAWVECSQRFLSLADLDAILTLRKPYGARITDLDDLLAQEFGGLFITSSDEGSSALPSEARIRQRLQGDRHTNDDLMSAADALTVDGTEAAFDSHATYDDAAIDPNSAFDRKLGAWSKVTVRLTHPLVQRYIERRIAKEDLKLTTNRMHVSVLIGCLRILCEPHSSQDPETLDRAASYCAVWLPEHLSNVDPKTMEPATIQLVATYLEKLLREEEAMNRWVANAAQCMNQDLLQQNDFRDNILMWFRQAYDLAPGDREWVADFRDEHALILFERLARCIALRWLDTFDHGVEHLVVFVVEWREKVPPPSHRYRYLRFLIIYQVFAAGAPIDEPSDENVDTYGLEGSALQVLQAARWTRSDENAHFFQRIGDALHYGEFGLHDDARRMYNRGKTIWATGCSLGYHAPLWLCAVL